MRNNIIPILLAMIACQTLAQVQNPTLIPSFVAGITIFLDMPGRENSIMNTSSGVVEQHHIDQIAAPVAMVVQRMNQYSSTRRVYGTFSGQRGQAYARKIIWNK